MKALRGIRRKEKAIEEKKELLSVLSSAKYVTIAMCTNNEPYLVTLNHGYDTERNCVYFHCAQEGKKIDILRENDVVWGQAILDKGYVQGSCDHLYASVHFKGKVTLVDDVTEKEHALRVMIDSLEEDPNPVYAKQVTEKSLKRVGIGRIDIEYMSGKKAEEVIISM
jgi:nitroimidazol reductase NimA-like FMN-containing flavoprotein (pyridoxamine 5'-phosphate oxidase superfamily)